MLSVGYEGRVLLPRHRQQAYPLSLSLVVRVRLPRRALRVHGAVRGRLNRTYSAVHMGSPSRQREAAGGRWA